MSDAHKKILSILGHSYDIVGADAEAMTALMGEAFARGDTTLVAAFEPELRNLAYRIALFVHITQLARTAAIDITPNEQVGLMSSLSLTSLELALSSA